MTQAQETLHGPDVLVCCGCCTTLRCSSRGMREAAVGLGFRLFAYPFVELLELRGRKPSQAAVQQHHPFVQGECRSAMPKRGCVSFTGRNTVAGFPLAYTYMCKGGPQARIMSLHSLRYLSSAFQLLPLGLLGKPFFSC